MMPLQDQAKQIGEVLVPDLFRCPITLEMLVDPVTLSTGQTYERSSIEKWLGDGNRTCPVTMQELEDLSLVPNHTLRHLIGQHCFAMSTPLPPSTPKFESPYHESSMATLKDKIVSSLPNDLETRLEAVKRVRALTEVGEYSKKEQFVHVGFLKMLLEISLNSDFEEESPTKAKKWELVEAALQCVVNLLPYSKVGSLDILKEEAGVSSLCRLFEQGNIKIKQILCCLIHSFSSDMEYFKQPALQLGQTPSLLQSMISLLENSTSHPNASDAAVAALSGLCILVPNHGKVIKEGAIHGLVSYISTTEKRMVSKALATLETLLLLDSGKRSLMGNPKAVHALVKMVFGVSTYDDEGSESAVSSLLMLCCGSLVVRKEAVSAGAVTQLLLLLQSQCSGRAKCKAMKLLRMLKTLWIEHPRFFDVVWFR